MLLMHETHRLLTNSDKTNLHELEFKPNEL
jgi:hypothetical protein